MSDIPADRPYPWYQELGPVWSPSAAGKPATRVIDIHSHVEVPAAADIARPLFRPEYDPRMIVQPEESTRYNRELRATQSEKFLSTAARRRDMDNQGVDMQVLAIAPPQYYYWLEAGLAPRVAAIENDRIAEMAAEQPDRFVGIGTVPLNHPEAAAVEMERIHRQLGMNGIEINADVNGGDLDDHRFDPVWAKASELDMLVILHPHGWTEPRRMDDYYLINLVCMPLASTVAVARMIFGGVFDRFPDLKFLVVHGGGYLPFYFGRTDHGYRIRPEAQRHIPELPSHYLHKLHFDTTVFRPEEVEYLVREFGADRVLLGTDYPFDMGPTDPLGFLAQARLTESERTQILGANAARLLKIPPAS
jgi:aminocarboxymuconate-semialdehyde decarboxylase